MAKEHPTHILLVEDNPGDVRLTQEALRESGLPDVLSTVKDGVEALAFLRREGPYADAPRPQIILLDLNLPKKDGREVLAEVKADQDFRRIPVIVLTTSQSPEDVIAAYRLHANCFVTKPADLDDFINTIKAIKDFWLATAQLPAR